MEGKRIINLQEGENFICYSKEAIDLDNPVLLKNKSIINVIRLYSEVPEMYLIKQGKIFYLTGGADYLSKMTLPDELYKQISLSVSGKKLSRILQAADIDPDKFMGDDLTRIRKIKKLFEKHEFKISNKELNQLPLYERFRLLCPVDFLNIKDKNKERVTCEYMYYYLAYISFKTRKEFLAFFYENSPRHRTMAYHFERTIESYFSSPLFKFLWYLIIKNKYYPVVFKKKHE